MGRTGRLPVEGYRRNWGEQDPLKRKGLPIPGCPWTEVQLAVMALFAQGKTYAEIAKMRCRAIGTINATLDKARLASSRGEEEPPPLRELIKSPRVRGWLEKYEETRNG